MTVACPACGGHGSRAFTATDLNRGISTEEFRYYRCISCGLIFLSPLPEDLAAHYVGAYAPYELPPASDLPRRAAAERYKLDVVRTFRAGGRLLEIGPGFGAFAYLARHADFEVDAIEMDSRCSAYLEREVGVRTFTSDRPSAVIGGLGIYDVITLWHAIEHLPDAWRLLRPLAGHLAPDGVLVLTTPNPNALQYRVFGRFWVHVDAPRHVQLIPPRALIRHLAGTGLQHLSTTTRDTASRQFEGRAWWSQSFRNVGRAYLPEKFGPTERAAAPTGLAHRLGANASVALRHPKRATQALLRACWVASALPLQPLEELEGLGAAYTIVFRKPATGLAERGP